ncbi:MAG: hypothetical protein Q4C96_08440 [Planctomycetia bacterium]|nr:hypothetical protein [Planctomycetia bacterium]
MNIRQFLDHYGISENPFSDEEASTDPIFKGYGIDHAFHPEWDKIYGTPAEPTTSVVFGEKGSGKTALRLQMTRRLTEYNGNHPDSRVFVIPYDDFNPFIDRFREKQSWFWRRNIQKTLQQWKVWDHIDAILSLGVTQLIDRLLKVESSHLPAVPGMEELSVDKFSPAQKRDLLLLAMYYDQTSGEDRYHRWEKLRKLIKYGNFTSHIPPVAAIIWTVFALFLPILCAALGIGGNQFGFYLHSIYWLFVSLGPLFYGIYFALTWWKSRKIRRGLRTLEQNQGELAKTLRSFPHRALYNQPIPLKDRSEDRYEMLTKFQSILKTLGMPGIIVLLDRADEPYQINGIPERMKAFLWPMLDNKLLKHPGIGFKMLLPGELYDFVRREDDDFRLRARLDKQNLVTSFDWTGQALYDLANIRIHGSISPAHLSEMGENLPRLEDLFENSITRDYLIHAFQSLKVPRRLFKFLYQNMITHTKMYTDSNPKWTISQETFLSVMKDMQKIE